MCIKSPTESSHTLLYKQLFTAYCSVSSAVGNLLLMCKASRWRSSYLGITQHLWSQNNRVWQLRMGSCHCWWVKQAVWIKPANSGAEPCRQPTLVYVRATWQNSSGGNRKGFTSGCRCWQPVEDVDIFYVIILAARWESKAVSGMLLSVFISSCFLMSGSLEKPSCSYIIAQVCSVFAEVLTEEWKEFHIKWSVGSFAWLS